MRVEVTVLLKHRVELSKGAVCRIEVRDVTQLDAPSKTLSAYVTPVKSIAGDVVLTTHLDVVGSGALTRRLNVWARLSTTGSGRTQIGDYVTTVAYPVDPKTGDSRIVVELERVGPERERPGI